MQPWDLQSINSTTGATFTENSFQWGFTRQEEEKSVIARGVCHILIEMVPERGLPELFRNLVELRDFYSKLPSHEVPLLPTSQRIEVTFGPTTVRPAFPVDYDEE